MRTHRNSLLSYQTGLNIDIVYIAVVLLRHTYIDIVLIAVILSSLAATTLTITVTITITTQVATLQ